MKYIVGLGIVIIGWFIITSVQEVSEANTKARVKVAEAQAVKEEKPDISVSFVSIREGQFNQPILKFSLTNTSGRTIQAVKGAMYAFDRFGDPIERQGLGVALDKVIKAGEAVTEEASWMFISDRLLTLLKDSPKDVTWKWETDKVAYEENAVTK